MNLSLVLHILVVTLSLALCVKWLLTPSPREKALTGLMCVGVAALISGVLDFSSLYHFLPQALDSASYRGFFRGVAVGVFLALLINGQLKPDPKRQGTRQQDAPS
jgi:hypothetical protein